MKSRNKIAELFPNHLFWDVDIRKLDVKKDIKLIIPRALFMTTRESFPEDIAKLEKLYTAAQIIDQLKATKERISNAVCKMVAARYLIPPFYRFKPSIR